MNSAGAAPASALQHQISGPGIEFAGVALTLGRTEIRVTFTRWLVPMAAAKAR